MKIRQHIPSFIDGAEPYRDTVANADELLNLNWVKQWNLLNEGLSFYRYSKAEYGPEWLLMAEWKSDDKHIWWVIGYMDSDIDLPTFEAII